LSHMFTVAELGRFVAARGAREAMSTRTKKISSRAKKTRQAPKAIVSPPMRQLPRGSGALGIGNESRFAEVIGLIESARARAYQAVNSELVALYWSLGEHISKKIANGEWSRRWSRR